MIMIHGQPEKMGLAGPVLQFPEWADGRIAVRNTDMDEL